MCFRRTIPNKKRGSAKKKFEAACPKISQARAEHKRQVELAKYKETLREKEKRHRQEVEELKKRFGVE